MGSLRDTARHKKRFSNPHQAFRYLFDDPRLCNADVACEFLGRPYTGPWVSPNGVSPVPHLHLTFGIFKFGSQFRIKFLPRKHVKARNENRWEDLSVIGEYTYKRTFLEEEWDEMWEILRIWEREVHVFGRKKSEERNVWFAVLNFPVDWIVHEESLDPHILISTVER
jgi:hypothetical protein